MQMDAGALFLKPAGRTRRLPSGVPGISHRADVCCVGLGRGGTQWRLPEPNKGPLEIPNRTGETRPGRGEAGRRAVPAGGDFRAAALPAGCSRVPQSAQSAPSAKGTASKGAAATRSAWV